jgi:hypothetical protein
MIPSTVATAVVDQDGALILLALRLGLASRLRILDLLQTNLSL